MTIDYQARFPKTPKELLPSEHQQRYWGQWINLELGINDKGAFSGWCPIHDKSRKEVSALFYFKPGIMVCLGNPSCHDGKRSISLTNVTFRMISGHGS